MTKPTLECDDCGSFIELQRRQNGTLALTCDCPETRAVRVARKIPDGWGA